ncbi:MAG: CBS domain-containing protein [Alphaproteobacteria bacterium]|jgi:CBS domain-containing protein|nr:CBS domain-containing protein [Alphaproteobacteria bacterium]
MIARTIAQIVSGRTLVAVGPNETVRVACTAMEAADVGALAVMQDDRLVGILSERDVIRRCICRGRPTAATRVSDVMTPNPATIDVAGSLTDAVRTMMTGRFRHLPVLSAGQVVAMLSIRDLPV